LIAARMSSFMSGSRKRNFILRTVDYRLMTFQNDGQQHHNDCAAARDQDLLKALDPRVDTARLFLDTFVPDRADVHVGVNLVINFR